MGTVALDGTKIHANASRPNRVKPGGMHSALSYEHAGKIEAQLKQEVAGLLAKAEAADQADVPDGMSGLACSPSQLASRSSIPEELERRKVRLEKLAEARATIEARAKERFGREHAEHLAKLAARGAKTGATGKETRRQAAPAAGGGGAADGSGQSDRRRVAHHARHGRLSTRRRGWVRAVLQCPGRGGRGKPAGGGSRCGAGHQRQAAASTDLAFRHVHVP
jgi:hypothetical protein